jgi:hypothetical protein
MCKFLSPKLNESMQPWLLGEKADAQPTSVWSSSATIHGHDGSSGEEWKVVLQAFDR